MVTIKELAEKEFPTIPKDDYDALESLKYIGIEMDNTEEYNYVREAQQNIFILGAKTVLNEVLKFMDDDNYISYQHVRDLIKQMKGE